MRKNNLLKYLYWICLHSLVFVLILRTDVWQMFKTQLGFYPEKENDHYYRMLQYHRRIDANLGPGFILFIGDSITQGLCVACVANNAVNYGIGGDTVQGVLDRLNNYRSINEARTVVLAIGINDLLRKKGNDILSGYQEILALIPKSVNVVVSALFPIDEEQAYIKFRINDEINNLNDGLKIICNNTINCIFVNSGVKLLDESLNLDDKFHEGDGIHLSTEGYKIWIQDLKKIIEQGSSIYVN